MNMTQVILKQLNPIVIEKLKRLAQSHQRTLEEEITSILEDVTEKEEEATRSEGFWDMTLQFRERMQQENITFDDADFADLRDRSVGRDVEF
jgi:macrodomain Ter protein organizer (MatP/YcbG family)